MKIKFIGVLVLALLCSFFIINRDANAGNLASYTPFFNVPVGVTNTTYMQPNITCVPSSPSSYGCIPVTKGYLAFYSNITGTTCTGSLYALPSGDGYHFANPVLISSNLTTGYQYNSTLIPAAAFYEFEYVSGASQTSDCKILSLQALNIDQITSLTGLSATLTGPLTFSAGSSMTSTIYRSSIPFPYDSPIVPIMAALAVDQMQDKNGAYWTNSTSCGITEAINEFQNSPVYPVLWMKAIRYIIPQPCLPTTGNWAIGDFSSLVGQSGHSTYILPSAPMYSLISTTSMGNGHIGDFSIVDPNNNLIGVGVSISNGLSNGNNGNITFLRGGAESLTQMYVQDFSGRLHDVYFEDPTSSIAPWDLVLNTSDETVENIGACNIWIQADATGGNLYKNFGSLSTSGPSNQCLFQIDTVQSTFEDIGSYNYIVVTGTDNTFKNVFNAATAGSPITDTAGGNIYENIYNLNNTSLQPDYVVGQHGTLAGMVLCYNHPNDGIGGRTYNGIYSCGTIPVGIELNSAAGIWLTGGTYVDSLTLNGNVQPMVIAGTGQYTNGVYNGNYKGFTASQYATCTVTPISTSNTMGTPVVTSGTGTAWTATSVTSEFLYQYLNYGLGTAPYAIVTDSLKNIWVMNYNSNNVTKLNPALGVQGTFTTGSYSFSLAVDAANELWVPLYASNIVLVLNTAGTIISEYTVGFDNPIGIVIDKSGNVWVSNYGNYSTTEIPYNGGNGITSNAAVARFQGIAIDSNGDAWVAVTSKVVKIPHLGGNGITYSGFTTAQNIAVDSNDNKWIVDVGANVVVEMPAAGGNGFSYTGSFINQGIPLVGIVIDANDHVWVSQTAAGVNTIKEYAQGITIGTYYTGAAPNGVAISNEGNIYVSGGGIPYNVTKISPAGLIITTDNSSFNYVCTVR